MIRDIINDLCVVTVAELGSVAMFIAAVLIVFG